MLTRAAAYTLADQVENMTYTGALAFTGTGNALANTLTGAAGKDVLSGLDGSDKLYGMDGADTLIGGLARDLLYGGSGADKFSFLSLADFGGVSGSTSDLIADFSQAEGDRIDLSAIDPIAGGADDAFTYLGSAAFTHNAGELRSVINGADTYVVGDVDGDGKADFMLHLTGALTLGASDFLL
ncbi:type I secretion C-terminal target domain-containing protein [Novosphingobium colocasiae]